MRTNQQLRNHLACPFQGSCGSRRETVQKLFAKTTATAKKNLRDFACEKDAHEPFVGASAKQNKTIITAYILGTSLYIGCSDKTCPSLETNGRFFLGKCIDEPAMEIPNSLARAADKEIRAMKRER